MNSNLAKNNLLGEAQDDFFFSQTNYSSKSKEPTLKSPLVNKDIEKLHKKINDTKMKRTNHL